MTNAEFVQATSRLEGYFDKKYTTEQLKEMFYMLKEWSLEKYTKAVKYCIRNCKYLPTKRNVLYAKRMEFREVYESSKILHS